MSKKSFKPVIIITSGDPAGIGPEIIAKSLSSETLRKKGDIFIVGEPDVFKPYWDNRQIRVGESLDDYKWQSLNIIPTPGKTEAVAGTPTDETAACSLKALEMALSIVTAEPHAALVTGPIYKKGVQNVGFNFPGHTEYLSERTNSKVLMSFWGRKMKVASLLRFWPIGGMWLLGLAALAFASLVVLQGSGVGIAARRPTGEPQLDSIVQLPAADGEMCEWVPASASAATSRPRWC